ncbi:hypothetical protein B7P43_G01157 [Cryptotermes secundus]|uniref:Uncharacterized protein n=1 Tax=Cryptotermes secundus TaxID=105785 RepID=A0A2J7QZX1_9NEOP|nr:hypothetical protein B7P43_G01157 [Cryptotermes secundus]
MRNTVHMLNMNNVVQNVPYRKTTSWETICYKALFSKAPTNSQNLVFHIRHL